MCTQCIRSKFHNKQLAKMQDYIEIINIYYNNAFRYCIDISVNTIDIKHFQ